MICQKAILLFLIQLICTTLFAQKITGTNTIFVDSGWAGNSINTVVFRKNSLCTYNTTQYIAFYDKNAFVVLGKRKLNSKKWVLVTTRFKGNVSDAHNAISIIADGDGYLHLAWNHHNNQLHYSKSTAPGSLIMTEEISMTGIAEKKVTYPEFYVLPNGNLIFLYRNGESGKGNLVVNRYDFKTKHWTQLYANLIDGEGQRNAYWQACVDKQGAIHLSWVWRESPDVSSNHDLCYAKSTDGGFSWQNSSGKRYATPITAAIAEYICHIPQQSELINQTSMCADEEGNPVVASYWKDKGDSVPQYHIAYCRKNNWEVQNTGFRTTSFSLSGAGTKRIPISRPQIISYAKSALLLIYRDEERGSKVSVAINSDFKKGHWEIKDLTNASAGSWEPTYDTELWKQKKHLHLFVQCSNQQDKEGLSGMAPQPVQVLEVKIDNF
jgi:hypothetical protein